MRVRLEVGASCDYTNEIYYLDSLATPTLVSRQRFDTPQTLGAGVVLLSTEGTRARRGTGYALTQEISIGDRLRRATTIGRWRQALGPDWRLLFIPRAQYRKDRTLGRDFEEYQAAGAARLRRAWDEGVTSAELGLQSDWLQTTGSGAGLLADRWSVATSAALEHGDFTGIDGRLDYTFRVRSFPDSLVRDHLEHETQARMRLGWGLANFVALEASTIRRLTIHLAPTSLDNFWEELAVIDYQQNAGGRIGAAAQVQLEAVQFDVQDDVLYFDHQRVNARAGPRYQPGTAWTLEAGPQIEWLVAGLAPDEAYDELAGFLAFETVAAGTLWNVAPAAGRRHYRQSASSPGFANTTTGHTSYRFVELDLFGDQSITGGFRARVSANGRWEFHDDSVENAASLYFSVDVRRLF